MTTATLDAILTHIGKSVSIRSDALAKKFGGTPAEIDVQLAGAVQSRQLVACKIIKPGKPDVHEYRLSEASSDAAGGYDYAKFSISPRAAEALRSIPKAPPRTPTNQNFSTVAAKPAMETTMPKEFTVITRDEFLALIASKPSMARADLIKHYSGRIKAVDQHLWHLGKATPPLIESAARGQYRVTDAGRKHLVELAGKPKAGPVEKPQKQFPRSTPAELEKLDPASKRCTMNCGPHAQDPRSMEERKLQCDDCETVNPDPKRPDYERALEIIPTWPKTISIEDVSEKLGLHYERAKHVLSGLFTAMKVDRIAGEYYIPVAQAASVPKTDCIELANKSLVTNRISENTETIIEITEPTTEFCLWSHGELVIDTGRESYVIAKPVADRLVRFLGRA